MESKLKIICGLKVVDAAFTDSDAGIIFEKEINLVVYNKYILTGLSLSEASLLIDKIVIDINEDECLITIKFDCDLTMHIDMRDDAYTGPEAMQLRVPGEPIVIWN